MFLVYIGVGSNINPEENIIKAFRLIQESVLLTSSSVFYETSPVGGRNQNNYINGVWEVRTDLEPAFLKFKVLRSIESGLGRIRLEDKYASRCIDLDILIYGEVVIETTGLVIPDLEILKRSFIGIPLHELAPDLILPNTGELLADVVLKMERKKLVPAWNLTNTIKKGINYE